MTWLFLALGGLRKGLAALWGVMARYPWQAALVAALCLSGWLYMGKQSETRRADAWHHAWQAQKNASEAAAAAQKALNAKIQTTYKEAANVAQERYDALSSRSGDLARDYIATHRLWSASGPSCGGHSSASTSGAGISQDAAAEADMVAVSARDVETCTADYSYARAAYEWATSLVAVGIGK